MVAAGSGASAKVRGGARQWHTLLILWPLLNVSEALASVRRRRRQRAKAARDFVMADLVTKSDLADAPEPEPTTELTEIGEQYVIPGCERDQARGPKQGKLWD